jgi:hypothetical protein
VTLILYHSSWSTNNHDEGVLGRPIEQEDSAHVETIASLREILYKLANQYRNSVTVSDKQLGLYSPFLDSFIDVF